MSDLSDFKRLVHEPTLAAAQKRAEQAESEAARLLEALKRLVADLETNSEAGAPEYAHATLAQEQGAGGSDS